MQVVDDMVWWMFGFGTSRLEKYSEVKSVSVSVDVPAQCLYSML